MTLTPELLADLRKKAKPHATYPYSPDMHAAALERACRDTPFVMLHLLDRIAELERLNEQNLRLAEDQSKAYGEAMGRVAALQEAIRLNADAFDEAELRRLGVSK